MGKAKHPHNTKRPSPAAVKKALAKGDMDALRLALTPRQVAYCREYVVDFKGTDAAIRAGYSPKNAGRQAYLLHMNEGVRAYIEHLQLSNQAKAIAITPDWVTQKTVQVVNTADKVSDQMRALELLAKILGMLKDRQEISGPDGEAIQVMNRKIEEDATAITNLIEALSQKRTFVISDNHETDE